MRILLIQDSRDSIARISNILKSKEIAIDSSLSATEALEMCSLYEYNLIILEQKVNDEDDSNFIDKIRDKKIDTPILVLSSEDNISKKVSALRKGADDYIIEPFSVQEFLARIKAIIRRANGYSHNRMKNGNLEIDFSDQKAYYAGNSISLTKKEYLILEFLFLKKGTTLDKHRFLSHLYHNGDEPEIKVIDVFVCKLRKKLEEISGGINFIGTDWGRGYYLVDLEN